MDYFEDPDTGPTRREQEMIDVIDKLKAELAAEREARQKAEANDQRTAEVLAQTHAALTEACAARGRLIAIEREARALLANIKDPRRQALDIRGLEIALEAK